MKKIFIAILLVITTLTTSAQIPFKGPNGKYGFKDETGKVIIPCKYAEVHGEGFKEGFCAVKMNVKKDWGFINSSGKEITPYKYFSVDSFHEGLCYVSSLLGGNGFIDVSGKMVIRLGLFEYPLGGFSGGVVKIMSINKKSESYFLDKEGNKREIPKKEWSEEVLASLRSSEKDVLDSETKTAADKTDKVDRVNAVSASKPEGRVDITTPIPKGPDVHFVKSKTHIDYPARIPFKGSNGKYGFKDDAGKVIIPCSFVEIHEAGFNEGYCAVRLDYQDKSNRGKWAIIDISGHIQISDIFSYLSPSGFQNGKWNYTSIYGEEGFITNYDNGSLYMSAIPSSEKTGLSNNTENESYSANIKTSERDNMTQNREEAIFEYASSTTSSKTYPKTITKSDVDENIPIGRNRNSNTFAVIIANENYKRETKVDYALNDGEIFKQYCLQTLGLPKSNVHCVKDATLNDFIAEMDWLSKVSNAYNGDARIIVYYAGHGIPDEKTQSSYLLPVDGYGSNVNTGYKLSDMYSTLSTYPAKSVMVFLDACFSGAERNGGMLASARGVALKAKPETPKGNMVVISAASGDETAYKYEEESHGMFTYFLLKKLQEDGADTTLGELADYITTNVARKSIVVNMKSQTPTISASGTLASNWKSLTFNE